MNETQLNNLKKQKTLMLERLDKDSLEIAKIKDLSDQADRSQKGVERLQQELEFNQNHYLLIENFVEKYMPITV